MENRFRFPHDALGAAGPLRPLSRQAPERRGPSRRAMISTALSAIASTGALVFPLGIVGMIDASITRRPSTPRTLRSAVTTASGSPSRPMRQVPTGW